LFPEIGDQEDAVRPIKCRSEGFRAVQIRCDDFLSEVTMLDGIAGESANFESPSGLQGAYNSAPLLPGCADNSDELSIPG
jgi:hypothetical protein